jgi:hypothetical protein
MPGSFPVHKLWIGAQGDRSTADGDDGARRPQTV